MKTRVFNDQNNISVELHNQGKSEKEIQQHPDYTRCVKAKDNFQKILEMKYNRLAKLEQDIEKGQIDVGLHTYKLTCLQKELDQLKHELSESESESESERFFYFQQKEFKKIKSRNLEGLLENEQSEMSFELINEREQEEKLKEISAREISSNISLDRLRELKERIDKKYND